MPIQIYWSLANISHSYQLQTYQIQPFITQSQNLKNTEKLNIFEINTQHQHISQSLLGPLKQTQQHHITHKIRQTLPYKYILCAKSTGGQFKYITTYLYSTPNIKQMAQETQPLILFSSAFIQNSNSLHKKAQDEDTNDSVSIHKIKPFVPQEETFNDTNPNTINAPNKERKTKVISSTRIFDIRVGLGLNEATVDTCRKKFQHLLPPYLSARISKNHLSLLNLADKIDNHLTFQKEMRGVKSVLYSDISKNLAQNNGIETGVHHLRQILYLDQEFYSYKIQKKKTSYDIRISINSKYQNMEPRRMILRKSIFEYLKTKHQQYLNQNKLQHEQVQGYWVPSFSVDIGIPMISLPWEQTPVKSSSNNSEQDKTSASETIPKINIVTSQSIQQKKQMNLKQIMDKNKVGESFKDRLYRIVAQKQSQMKLKEMERQKEKQANKHLSTLSTMSKDTYIKIVDEINMLYLSKNISNMFYITLVQSLIKRTGFSKKEVEDTVSTIILQSKYLQEIKTNNGIIVKIDKAEYKKFRTSLEGKSV